MTEELEKIRALLPEFERAVYKTCASDEERHTYARGKNCMRASEYGKMFLRGTGIKVVRREVHFIGGLRGSGHSFISLLESGVKEITMEDAIVDPTYLQYADDTTDTSIYPNTFVGTRQEILNLMQSTEFTTHTRAPLLYQAITWSPRLC